MLRKQHKRAAQGKATAFRVGGQVVDSRRISRFVRRYGMSEIDVGGDPNDPEPGELGYFFLLQGLSGMYLTGTV